MVNNTVNGKENSNLNGIVTKKRFKAAGFKETPRVVAVEIRQEDKDKIKSLKTHRHVSIPTLRIEPINLQAGEFVSIKAYPGGNPEKENTKKTRKEEITH